jgi:hypothetical protein
MRLLGGAAALALLLLLLGPEETWRAHTPRAPTDDESSASGAADSAETQGTPAPDAAPAHSAKPRRCEVIVTGPRDQPVAGLEVWLRAEGDRWDREVTDADGWAAFERPSGEWEGRLCTNEETARSFEVRGGVTRVRIAGLVPLEVALVDARTGAPVAGGAVRLARPDLCIVDPVPLTPVGSVFLLPLFPCPPGGDIRGTVEVSAPGGLVPAGSIELRGTLDPRADALRAVVPLWPEARLRVRAVVERDSVNGSAIRVAYHLAARADACVETLAEDEWLVRGFPYLRGHRLDLWFSSDEWSLTLLDGGGALVWGNDPFAALTVDVRSRGLRVVEIDPSRTPYGVGPANREVGPELPGDPTASIDVCAIGANGQCIPGALVAALRGRPAAGDVMAAFTGSAEEQARADGQGIVCFRDLNPGEWTVELREPGFLPTVVRAVAIAGQTTRIDLREGLARTVSVLVRDERRIPVPFAGVDVCLGTRARYIGINDGVQALTHLTGVDGRLLLPGLPADRPVTIEASLGSKRGTTVVEAGADSCVVDVAEVEDTPIPPWMEPFDRGPVR